MKSKYYPPLHGKSHFHCIYCNVDARQIFCLMKIKGDSAGYGWLDSPFTAAVCTHCNQWSYWHDTKMVVPAEAPVEPPHPDLPADCQIDYKEARDVFSRSPRAAAALLRLCIQ